jgi:hypothetical protein
MGDAERAVKRQRGTPWRMAGLAAGCFGLAVSLAVASHALTTARPAALEAVPLALSPASALRAESALHAESAENEAAPVVAPLPNPTEPPAIRAVDSADAPADRAALAEPVPMASSPEAVGVDPAVPLDDGLEREHPRAPAHSPALTAGPSGDRAEPSERPASDAAHSMLDDQQLEELFALESRSDTYRCGGDAPGGSQPAEVVKPAQVLWREWRRAQQTGDVDSALLALCELRRISPSDARVPTEIAALALRWGDARGAQEAARAGLLLEPENAALKQLIGDARALLGEPAESRRLWLEPFGEDTSKRAAGAIDFFEQRGAAALERSDFARARTFFRRAAVMSHGDLHSSAGLSQALSGLAETRAAVAWAERAALAAPRDARLQMSHGDALYRAGDMPSARRAWSASAQLSLTPAIRRRLSKGHP